MLPDLYIGEAPVVNGTSPERIAGIVLVDVPGGGIRPLRDAIDI